MVEIDLEFLGISRLICRFADLDEGWLVDPGPESSHANFGPNTTTLVTSSGSA